MPEPLPSPQPDGGAPPVAEARFACAIHRAEAGAVRLHGGDAAGWAMTMESFVCRQCEPVSPPIAEALRGALERGDVRAVHLLDAEWAPFFCSRCGLVYCGRCWRTRAVFDPDWPTWMEEVRGVCPEGHERMLTD